MANAEWKANGSALGHTAKILSVSVDGEIKMWSPNGEELNSIYSLDEAISESETRVLPSQLKCCAFSNDQLRYVALACRERTFSCVCQVCYRRR